MRWTTVGFGLACGAAAFSLVAIFRAAFGYPEFIVGYVYLFFTGFGLGMVGFIGLDTYDLYLDHAASREKTYADADLQRARAESARAPAPESAMTQKGTVAPPDGETDSLVYTQRWRVMAHRFLTNADRHGFAIRLMVGRGIVTWDGWLAMTGVLCDAGVMVKSPRAGWAEKWDYARWEAESRTLPLPCPMSDPPEVAISPTNNAQQPHNAAAEVVDGVARPAD